MTFRKTFADYCLLIGAFMLNFIFINRIVFGFVTSPWILWITTIVGGIIASHYVYKRWSETLTVHSVETGKPSNESFPICQRVVKNFKGKIVENDFQNFFLTAWVKTPGSFRKSFVTFFCEDSVIHFNVVPSNNFWIFMWVSSTHPDEVKSKIFALMKRG